MDFFEFEWEPDTVLHLPRGRDTNGEPHLRSA
jgi:hypothetical protein